MRTLTLPKGVPTPPSGFTLVSIRKQMYLVPTSQLPRLLNQNPSNVKVSISYLIIRHRKIAYREVAKVVYEKPERTFYQSQW